MPARRLGSCREEHGSRDLGYEGQEIVGPLVHTAAMSTKRTNRIALIIAIGAFCSAVIAFLITEFGVEDAFTPDAGVVDATPVADAELVPDAVPPSDLLALQPLHHYTAAVGVMVTTDANKVISWDDTAGGQAFDGGAFHQPTLIADDNGSPSVEFETSNYLDYAAVEALPAAATVYAFGHFPAPTPGVRLGVYRPANNTFAFAIHADAANGLPGVFSGTGVQVPGTTSVSGWALVRISYNTEGDGTVATAVNNQVPDAIAGEPSGATGGLERVGEPFSEWQMQGVRLKDLVVFDRFVSSADHGVVVAHFGQTYSRLAPWVAAAPDAGP